MEFNTIVNPETGRKCFVNSQTGKRVLRNYLSLQNGGADGCGFNPTTNRCSKTAKANPEWCGVNPKTGRCVKSSPGKKTAPKSAACVARGQCMGQERALPKGVYEITLKNFRNARVAKSIAAIINDFECGPMLSWSEIGWRQVGDTKVSGSTVSFRLQAVGQQPNADIQDVFESLSDDDSLCQEPASYQYTWRNNMSMANFRSGSPLISVRPKVNIPITLLPK